MIVMEHFNNILSSKFGPINQSVIVIKRLGLALAEKAVSQSLVSYPRLDKISFLPRDLVPRFLL